MPTFRAWVSKLRPWGLGALALGSAARTAGSLGYFDDETLPAFVIEKLPLPHEALWLFALKWHVVAAAWALPGCLLLLSKTLLRRAPRVHRWLGRITAAVVLLGLAPSGFYLSLFAKGGLLSTLGFILSGAIVVFSMVQAIRTARTGRFTEHRRYTLHVLAQLSVAVSSRALLFVFDAAGFDTDVAYLIALWVPVFISAVVAEVCAHRFVLLPNPWRKNEASALAGDVDPVHAGVRAIARA